MNARLRIVFVWLAVAAAGCVSTRSIVRHRFATQYACPEDDVDVSSQTGNQYRASGCGKSTVYVCGSISRMDSKSSDCVEEDAMHAPSPGERERPVLPTPDPRVAPY